MWRSLRDGYIRYKKHVKGQSGSARRKHCYFTWSDQLEFLGEALKLRPRTANSTPLLTESEVPQSPTMRISDATVPQQSALEPHSSGPSQSYSQPGLCSAEPSPPSRTPDFISSTQTPLPPNTNPQSPLSSLLLQKIINAENRKEYDAVDLLFMSYADTFRKLSLRKQAELKIKLAKIFAVAELSEMDNDFPMHEPQTSSSIIHSIMLEEPTQHSFVADDLKSECDSN